MVENTANSLTRQVEQIHQSWWNIYVALEALISLYNRDQNESLVIETLVETTLKELEHETLTGDELLFKYDQRMQKLLFLLYPELDKKLKRPFYWN